MGTVINPSEWNYLSIFKLLDREKKEALCLKLIEFINPMETLKKDIENRIAKFSNMRPQTVVSLPIDKKAGLLAKTITRFPYDLMTRVFIEFHLKRQNKLVKDFLDLLKIPHKDGNIIAGTDLTIFDEETLSSAATALKEKNYSEEDIIFYFATLLANTREPFKNLSLILQKRLSSDSVTAAEDEPRRPEDNEEFTTLDTLLIRTIVDVAQGIEGALDEDHLLDLVEEIIKLNSSRHPSYFHRGYMEGILGRGFLFSFPESNSSRLAWYFTGIIMGLLRRQRDAEILELCKTQKRILDEISTIPKFDPCYKMLAPNLHLVFTRNNLLAQSVAFITKKDISLLNPSFLVSLLEDGANYLREGRTGDADLLIAPLYKEKERIFKRYDQLLFFPVRVARKKAQILQHRGDFSAAREILESILSSLDEDDIKGRAYIYSDLGLIEAGFRTISQIKLPSPDNQDVFKTSLQKGAAYFKKAIEGSNDTPNAQYCLGMLEHLLGHSADASNLMDVALVGMLEDEAAYQAAGILDTCRFVLAMSIYESMDESRFNYASENLKKAFDNGFKPPSNLLKNLLEISGTLLDRDFAAYVGKYLYEVCGGEVLRHIDSKHIELCDSIRCAVEKLSFDAKTSVAQKWEYNYQLLRYYLSINDIEKAGEKLDILEAISIDGPEAVRFLDLISETKNVEPAWDRSDARFAEVRLLESAGKYVEAAVLLTGEFHRLCSDVSDQLSFQEASNILERIQGYGISGDFSIPLQERIRGLSSTEHKGMDIYIATDIPFAVLIVGGNETQMRYDNLIKTALNSSYPNLSVEFFHTNWSSMWGEQLDKIKHMFLTKRLDLVIIMRFIRTEMGRRLRGLCNDMNINWYPCTGHGRASIESSIISGYKVFTRQQ
ncbi:MAG TPA: hypothetical protein VN328_12490 [Thermodesulfovibrionales bacterium]|nr:hypothetical protein [Thermodesulfovibrionales bacterium]